MTRRSGLLTRAGWIRRAERLTRRPHSALLLLDLNDFKPINDRFGHHAGDAVLAAVGARLTSWCDRDAVAGRLGGDEFVVALGDDAHLPERLVDLRNLLCRPVIHDGHRLMVTASIGACRLADLPDPSLSTALRKADRDMYRHKGQGRRGRRHRTPLLRARQIIGDLRDSFSPAA